MKNKLLGLLIVVLCACAPETTNDAGISDSGVAADVAIGPFTFTSSAFTDGGEIPVAHTCGGDDISPAFSWQNPPEGTESFALVLVDETINFNHSIIWDISADARELPEDIEKSATPSNVPGAKQARAWNNVQGYAGPCPPAPQEHTYVFTLHALNVETLENATGDRFAITTLVEAASIASLELRGRATIE